MTQNLDRFKLRIYKKGIGMTTCFCIHSSGLIPFVNNQWEDNIEDCTIMQSTGLYDKNGKMIYEGDILKRYDLSPQQIKEEGDKDIVQWDGGFNITFCDGQCSEIIGNIYETPEFLENL